MDRISRISSHLGVLALGAGLLAGCAAGPQTKPPAGSHIQRDPTALTVIAEADL